MTKSPDGASATPKEQIARLRDDLSRLRAETFVPPREAVNGNPAFTIRHLPDRVNDQVRLLSAAIRDSPVVTLSAATAAGYLFGRAVR